MRDPSLPLRYRASSFRSLLNLHAPFGFHGTEQHLCALLGARRTSPWPPRRARDWTEAELLQALDALEKSRASHLRYRAVLAERRSREKAEHRRQPTRGDRAALDRVEWLKDADEAARRHPGSREARRDARPS
ncbi:hypothetical protein CCE01nite_10910 [Cellulomonas cellasea]|uniref:Uncharacterized protein n=1 Tax=Cellulomonas cellasea TaxID=43670 RepID=A0A4Y3KSW3_9CELL|nr:hypothetical protein CCE01nite_10910 [Cellulomonas cellasea]